ncbi:hypothetical protein SAMN03080615_00068 [Amphritea atlantica]|uniref:Uncharacterized protein n=1 Tax=Amphritea atlantica TaxID=355243 RepID=A0A1H9CMW1_9GAMM|nr:hypothetical protein [Amphritea atlantica]SEQ02552.1 hypothetical protein SAMN03080615_00068 [Amphritea atlantica]
MEFLNNATIAGVIGSMLAFFSAFVMYKISKNYESKEKKKNVDKEALKDLRELKRFVLDSHEYFRKLIFNNCFSGSMEQNGSSYLMMESTIYHPRRDLISCELIRNFPFHQDLPDGFYKIVKGYNAAVEELLSQNDRIENEYTDDYAGIKHIIFQLEAILNYSNEIITHCEWFELKFTDRKKYEEISSQTKPYFEGYYGLYCAPLKEKFRGDKITKDMRDSYHEARKNTNDTGMYI